MHTSIFLASEYFAALFIASLNIKYHSRRYCIGITVLLISLSTLNKKLMSLGSSISEAYSFILIKTFSTVSFMGLIAQIISFILSSMFCELFLIRLMY